MSWREHYAEKIFASVIGVGSGGGCGFGSGMRRRSRIVECNAATTADKTRTEMRPTTGGRNGAISCNGVGGNPNTTTGTTNGVSRATSASPAPVASIYIALNNLTAR